MAVVPLKTAETWYQVLLDSVGHGASVGFLAPLDFLAVPAAAGLGWLLFGEVPDSLMAYPKADLYLLFGADVPSGGGQTPVPFTTGAGNAFLQPETAKNRTLGFVISPSAVPGFSLSRLFTRAVGYHLLTRFLMNQTRPLALPDRVLNPMGELIAGWSHDPLAPGWVNRLEDRLTTTGDWHRRPIRGVHATDGAKAG